MSIKKTQKSMENLYYEVKTEIPCHEKNKPKINRVSFGRIYSLNILQCKWTEKQNGLKLKTKVYPIENH